jgi:hypothetical protein
MEINCRVTKVFCFFISLMEKLLVLWLINEEEEVSCFVLLLSMFWDWSNQIIRQFVSSFPPFSHLRFDWSLDQSTPAKLQDSRTSIGGLVHCL